MYIYMHICTYTYICMYSTYTKPISVGVDTCTCVYSYKYVCMQVPRSLWTALPCLLSVGAPSAEGRCADTAATCHFCRLTLVPRCNHVSALALHMAVLASRKPMSKKRVQQSALQLQMPRVTLVKTSNKGNLEQRKEPQERCLEQHL